MYGIRADRAAGYVRQISFASVRMITLQLYAWKGAKWIKRIQFLTADQPGFWEERGYSNTAYPWRNDRYS